MKVRSSWHATNVRSLVLLKKLISPTISKKTLLADFEPMIHFHGSLKRFSRGIEMEISLKSVEVQF